MQMPYTVVSKDVLKKLYEDIPVTKVEDEHYVVNALEEFDPNDYKRWVNKLRKELAANGGFNTQTHL